MLSFTDLKDFLDQKAEEFNHPRFIESDPIQIPHRFSRKEDIEITGFIIATIAWGNRKSIIANGEKLIRLCGNDPYVFVMNYDAANDFKFVHRTFNETDLDFFFRALQYIYREKPGLEALFGEHPLHPGQRGRIIRFREQFLETAHETRSEKHIANPLKGSSAKRINMFLRWMCRRDQKGVDFGLWKNIPMSDLHLPLDVHTGNVARKLGILTRSQNDWTSVEEIQQFLLRLDPEDPAKYDFALFGLGAFESF